MSPLTGRHFQSQLILLGETGGLVLPVDMNNNTSNAWMNFSLSHVFLHSLVHHCYGY
jgi:hypothetical protein